MPDQQQPRATSATTRQLSLARPSFPALDPDQASPQAVVLEEKGCCVDSAFNARESADNGLGITQEQATSSLLDSTDEEEVTQIAPEDLKVIKRLGEGGFATVSLCSLNGRLVAVKGLKPVHLSMEGYEGFIREATLLRKLHLRSIVEFVGIGHFDESSEEAMLNSMFIVQEFMDVGNLKTIVAKQMETPRRLYTNNQALEWLLQVAEALAFLHSASPMVIHRDLKLENVMLTTEGNTLPNPVAKLLDFGLSACVSARPHRLPTVMQHEVSDASTLKDQQHPRSIAKADTQPTGASSRPGILGGVCFQPGRTSSPPLQAKSAELLNQFRRDSQLSTKATCELSGKTGSWMYMPPEMFLEEEYTEKVDVFSFAMIAYELLHRYLMFFSISLKGTAGEIEAYARKVSRGYRPRIGDYWTVEIKELLVQCWDQNPAKRPPMSEVVQRIKKILDDDTLDAAKPVSTGCCAVQ